MEPYLIKRKIVLNRIKMVVKSLSKVIVTTWIFCLGEFLKKSATKLKKIVSTVAQNFASIQTIAKTILKEIGFGHFGMNKKHRFQDEDLRKTKER